MGIHQIYKTLKPLRNRINSNYAVLCAVTGLLTASGLAFLLSCVSLWIPVPFILRSLVMIYVASLVVSMIVFFWIRPGFERTIKIADSLGLKERLVTAHELRNSPSAIAAIQRADALEAVANTDFKALYPLKFPMKQGIACLLLLAFTVTVSFIPTASKEKASDIERFKAEMVQNLETLKKAKEETSKKSQLSAEQIKQLNKRMDDLLKELSKAQNPDDALKSLSKAKNELQDLKKQGDDTLKKLADSLAGNPQTKELSNALKAGNMDEIKKKLQELSSKSKSMEASTKKQLAEALKNASEKVSNKAELSQSLSDISKALGSGNQNAASSGMASLENSLSALSKSNHSADADQKQLNQLISALNDSKDKIEDLSEDSQFALGEENDQPGGSTDGKGDQASEGSQSGDGNQTGNGQGNGNQQGQNSSNTQSGGSGAGKGTTNKDAGYSGEESGANAGRERGDKTVKDYESIYIPERLGDGGEKSQIKGQKNKSGQSQWSDSENLPVEKGNIIPYNQVLGEYKQEAISGMERSSVPPGMQNIVKDYFSSLN